MEVTPCHGPTVKSQVSNRFKTTTPVQCTLSNKDVPLQNLYSCYDNVLSSTFTLFLQPLQYLAIPPFIFNTFLHCSQSQKTSYFCSLTSFYPLKINSYSLLTLCCLLFCKEVCM